LFWELHLNSRFGKSKEPDTYLGIKFKKYLAMGKGDIHIKLLNGELFVQLMENISDSCRNENTGSRIAKNSNYEGVIKSFSIQKLNVLPIAPTVTVDGIYFDQIRMKDSATRPIILPFHTTNGKVYKVMYKNENVRSDQIVMNIINLAEIIIKKDLGIDLDLVTYNVLPTSDTGGLIEIVDDCDTIYDIEQCTKSTILNYILDNNENMMVISLREKFIKSTAAFCAITYLLGVGDRHLHNIMIKKDARLFHIDYGFILGKDTLFQNPTIRVTKSMIEAMGGENSKHYKKFTELCVKIYNCLRRNIDIFMHLLIFLSKISPEIGKTEEEIREEIFKRFIPGEDDIEAELHIVEILQEDNHTAQLKDLIHYHTQEKTLSKCCDNLRSFVTNLWAYSNYTQ